MITSAIHKSRKKFLISLPWQFLAVIGIAFRAESLICLSLLPILVWFLGVMLVNPIISVWITAFANVTNVGIGKVWLSLISIFLMIPCFLFTKLLRGEKNFYVDYFDILFAIFGGLILITVPKWHKLRPGILGFIFIYLAPYLQVLIMREYCTKNIFKASIYVFLGVTATFAIQVFAAFLKVIATKGINLIALHTYGIGWAHSNYIAAFANLLLPLNVVIFLNSRNIGLRILAFTNLLLLGLGIITTISRGGFLTLLIGINSLGLGFSIAKRKLKYVIRTLILTVLVVIAVFLTIVGKLLIYRFAVATADPAVINRYKMWFQAIEYIKENPIVGGGPCQVEVFAGASWTTNPHNFYVKLGMEMGVFAIIVYALILLYLVAQSLKLVRYGNQQVKTLGAAFFSTIVLAVFNAAFEPTFAGFHYNTMFWYIMGLLLALCREDKKLWGNLTF